MFFKQREVINLRDNDAGEMNKLFAKLKDEKLYKFSQVASNTPEIQTQKISPFLAVHKEMVTDIDIKFIKDGAMYFTELIKKIDFRTMLTFKNDSDELLSDYNVEIHYPSATILEVNEGRVEGNYRIITMENSGKVFPGQTKTIHLENLTFHAYYIRKVIDSELKINIYTQKGLYSKSFPINEIVFKDSYYQEKTLRMELFNIN